MNCHTHGQWTGTTINIIKLYRVTHNTISPPPAPPTSHQLLPRPQAKEYSTLKRYSTLQDTSVQSFSRDVYWKQLWRILETTQGRLFSAWVRSHGRYVTTPDDHSWIRWFQERARRWSVVREWYSNLVTPPSLKEKRIIRDFFNSHILEQLNHPFSRD